MKHFKIKKKILAALATLIIPLSVSADDGIKIVVYGSADGDVTEVGIDDVRNITFQDETLTMLLFGDESKVFNYSDISKICFESIATEIESVTPGDIEDGTTIIYDGNVLRIIGCAQPSQLRIFDITGKTVISEQIKGDTMINVEGLSAGVYVLKVNNKTFKFSKI